MYVYAMATKTISITEEAYKRLVALRERDNESFSSVINRISVKGRLKDIYGILKGKRGEALEKNILEARKVERKLQRKKDIRLMKEFGL